MPIFDYVCEDCKHKQEHFVLPGKAKEKKCPKCGSENYTNRVGAFRKKVEYVSQYEYEKNIYNKEMNDLYQQIGKEALDEDTKTLDNLFGEDKVKNTFHESDYGHIED